MVKRLSSKPKSALVATPIAATVATIQRPLRRSRATAAAKRRAAAAADAAAAAIADTRLSTEEMSEMRRLAAILPTGIRVTNPHNDPLALIHDAARYISQLSSTLVARVQNGSLSPGEQPPSRQTSQQSARIV